MTKRISIRIPKGLYDKAVKIQKLEHYNSLSDCLRSAIRVGLKELELIE